MVDAESTNGVLSSPAPTKRERPTHTLPTDRITFTKQMDILRACTAINVNSGRGRQQRRDRRDCRHEGVHGFTCESVPGEQQPASKG